MFLAWSATQILLPSKCPLSPVVIHLYIIVRERAVKLVTIAVTWEKKKPELFAHMVDYILFYIILHEYLDDETPIKFLECFHWPWEVHNQVPEYRWLHFRSMGILKGTLHKS